MCESQVSGCQLLAWPGGKGPFDAGPRQAVLDDMILGDVIIVVKDAEAVIGRRQINQQRDEREQQANETRTGHQAFFVSHSARAGKRRGKVYFFAKGRWQFPARQVDNLGGRKRLDRLPLGRYIGSSRPRNRSL
jgi:uncharacterized protein YdbL (DUF1318 family)